MLIIQLKINEKIYLKNFCNHERYPLSLSLLNFPKNSKKNYSFLIARAPFGE